MKAILDYLAQSRDTVQAAIDDPAFSRAIHEIAEVTANALADRKKLLLAGNGGSAADAQHIAGEFIGRFNYDRRPAAALALTTDTSILTAVANDYGYDSVFERQIIGLGSSRRRVPRALDLRPVAEHPAGDRRGAAASGSRLSALPAGAAGRWRRAATCASMRRRIRRS